MKYINIIEANLVISQYSEYNKMSNFEIQILLSDQTQLHSQTVFQNTTKTGVEGMRLLSIIYLSILSCCFHQFVSPKLFRVCWKILTLQCF